MATHSNILAWKIPRSLADYSPQGCKASDRTERLHFHFLSESMLFLEYAGQLVVIVVHGEPRWTPGCGQRPKGQLWGFPILA